MRKLLVDYWLARGTLSLLVVCWSFHPFVCQCVMLQLSTLFSVVFSDIDLKYGI